MVLDIVEPIFSYNGHFSGIKTVKPVDCAYIAA